MTSSRTAGLTEDFGDLRAVDHIDLDPPDGGVAGFVGPNGAGKSTTIRMLLGLIEPTSGEGEVLGHSIERPSPNRLEVLIGKLAALASFIAAGVTPPPRSSPSATACSPPPSAPRC
jgi:ABC-2 type transport system ATP-binding protein